LVFVIFISDPQVGHTREAVNAFMIVIKAFAVPEPEMLDFQQD
jgi:hypothetical protein